MNKPLLLGGACLALSAHSELPESYLSLPPYELEASASDTQPPLAPPPHLFLSLEDQELSSSLRLLPGVTLRAQGGHAGEPVVRGLGWERVTTQHNGLNLYGACPSRMDPPVNLFTAGELDTISIELGPVSVTRGPVPMGGRITLETRLPLETAAPPRQAAEARVTGSSNGNAITAGLTAERADDTTAIRVQGSLDSSGDYTSGDGITVPAQYESEKASALWTQRLSDDLQFEVETRWIYNQNIDFIALPMDSRYEKTNLTTGSLFWTPEKDSLQSIRLRAGLGRVDHLMDNRDKANRGMVEASTPSTADSRNLGLLTTWKIGDGQLQAGVDGSTLDRDATRTRTMVRMNRTFVDPIWPDLSQEQAGGFAEWEQALGTSTGLRAGLRMDTFRQDAGKAGASIVPGPGVGKTTVEQAWVDVGGSDPGHIDNQDTLLSGNLKLDQSLSQDWTVQLGISRVEAVPNLTQRYLSFGPVPGGFGIGTPSLDPEKKWEVEIRTESRIGDHRVGGAVFAARIQDYLLPTTVAMLDVNGDGRIDRVKGTRNEDAELYGAEASAVLSLSPGVTVPVHLSFVRGEVRKTGAPLPEIPPLDLQAALRWQGPEDRDWFVEFGAYLAARQDRINPEFGEDETPSFALFHLRAGKSFSPHWRVEIGIENLFDREYHEHLTREALLPEGDLKPGDEVPGPGRGFHLSVQADW